MNKWMSIFLVIFIFGCSSEDKPADADKPKPSAAKTPIKSEASDTAKTDEKKSAPAQDNKKAKRVATAKKPKAKTDDGDDSEEAPFIAPEAPKVAKTDANDTNASEENPILAMKDVDALTYLLVNSKGSCDKAVSYSKESCDKFVSQVMNPKNQWYHIIKHYQIRKKHFYDQRVYVRMRKEIGRMGSTYAKPLREKYGLKN